MSIKTLILNNLFYKILFLSIIAPSDVGDSAGDRTAEGVPSDLQHTARDEEEEEEGAT